MADALKGAAAPVLPAALAETLSTATVFFSFAPGAQYVVAPGATLPALLSDGHALLSSALAVYELTAFYETTDAGFAVLHLLRQAKAVIRLADEMAQGLQQGGAA